VALAEFTALRQEIGSRSTAQHTLLTIQLSACGTVFGLVLGQVSEPQMLLVIPVLSFAFGMLWIDHATNISRLGELIRTTLNDRLRPETHLPDPIASEASARTFERNVVWRCCALAIPILFAFGFFSLASLLILRPGSALRQASARLGPWTSVLNVLWWIDLLLLVVFLVALTNFTVGTVVRRSRP
jgi:hypothetical protein